MSGHGRPVAAPAAERTVQFTPPERQVRFTAPENQKLMAAVARARLAQTASPVTTPPSPTDTTGLSNAIQAQLAALPAAQQGQYGAQYQTCMNQVNAGGTGLVTGAACLFSLYTQLDNLFKHGLPAAPAPAPAPATDYTIPIALGAAGLLVMVYVFTKKPAAPAPVAPSTVVVKGRKRR